MKEGFFMSVESVKNFFVARGLEDPVFTLEECGATVDLAAKTLDMEPSSIAKTLAFRVKDRYFLIVTKGDARIDNRKYKDFFKAKAKKIYCTENTAFQDVGTCKCRIY